MWYSCIETTQYRETPKQSITNTVGMLAVYDTYFKETDKPSSISAMSVNCYTTNSGSMGFLDMFN